MKATATRFEDLVERGLSSKKRALGDSGPTRPLHLGETRAPRAFLEFLHFDFTKQKGVRF